MNVMNAIDSSSNPREVVRVYCFEDTHLSYPVRQWRRFVAELGAVALHHVLTKHPHRQQHISLSDFEYCLHTITYNTYTNQPHKLAQHMVDWFCWLNTQDVVHQFTPYPHFKEHSLQKELVSRLSSSSNVSFHMASFLLERGMAPGELYSQKAVAWLTPHFCDEGYVNSFFVPPPHICWDTHCFHWFDEFYPESPLLYPHDMHS